MKTIRMRFALAFAAACGLVVTTSGVAQTSEPQETGGTILSGFAGGAIPANVSGFTFLAAVYTPARPFGPRSVRIAWRAA